MNAWGISAGDEGQIRKRDKRRAYCGVHMRPRLKAKGVRKDKAT